MYWDTEIKIQSYYKSSASEIITYKVCNIYIFVFTIILYFATIKHYVLSSLKRNQNKKLKTNIQLKEPIHNILQN